MIMNEETRALKRKAEYAAGLLKALSHPARLMICAQLRAGEMSVGDMEQILDIKQPNLSRELGKLRDEGLVETRRESKVVFYRLTSAEVRFIIDALCAALKGDSEICITAPHTQFGSTPPTPSTGAGQFARIHPTPNGGQHDET